MSKKKYHSYLCKDCEIDFVVNFKRKRAFCPKCGENLFVERKSSLWLHRSFSYKRPWTKEDDETLITSRAAGYKYREIAEVLDRTEKAVNRRVQQLRKQGIIDD